jgi:protein-disulfide isomerase
MSSNKTAKNKAVQKKKSPVPLYIILGVLVVSLAVGVILVNSNRNDDGPVSTPQSSSSPQAQRRQPQQQEQPIPVDPQVSTAAPGADPPHAKGPANAPLMIEEFGDYQCPACGFLNQTLHELESEYGDRIRLVFRQ